MYLEIDTPLHIDFFWYDIDQEWNYASEDFNRLFERVSIGQYPTVESLRRCVLRWLDDLMDDFDNWGLLCKYHYANISFRTLERDYRLVRQHTTEFKRNVAARANVDYEVDAIETRLNSSIRRGPATVRDPNSRPLHPLASLPQRPYCPPRLLVEDSRIATRSRLVLDSEGSEDSDWDMDGIRETGASEMDSD
jgi:hypothetical protein